MPRTKKVKSAGRFGARYGRKVRTKIAQIEAVQRKKQECLFCNGTAKRLSKGIWECKKCKKKFTSHTYSIPKKE
jgi:large subunit ribosomal protein L37Ae